MSSQNEKEALQQQLQGLLSFQNDAERLEFEAEKLHLNIMHQVRQLMRERNMNKKALAEELKTSKGYVSQLFSGDKLVNLKLLAKLQRIFKVRFDVRPQKTVEYGSDHKLLGARTVLQFPKRIRANRSKNSSVYTPDYTRSSRQKVA